MKCPRLFQTYGIHSPYIKDASDANMSRTAFALNAVFASWTGRAAEHTIRVELLLDLQKTRVVVSEQQALPIIVDGELLIVISGLAEQLSHEAVGLLNGGQHLLIDTLPGTYGRLINESKCFPPGRINSSLFGSG